MAILLGLSTEIRQRIWDIPFEVFAIFCMFSLAGFGVRLFRWVLLARGCQGFDRKLTLCAVYLGGFTMSLTPSRIGELWKVWALRRLTGLSSVNGLHLVLLDRLLELSAILLLISLGIFIGGKFLYLALVSIVIGIPIILLFWRPAFLIRLIKITWHLLRRPLPKLFATLTATCKKIPLTLNSSNTPVLLALAIIPFCLESTALYLLFSQIGGMVTLPTALSGLALSNLAGVLTGLPGGIGGNEATMTYILVQASNPIATAAIMVLIVRICTLWLSILIGLGPYLYLNYRILTKTQTSTEN